MGAGGACHRLSVSFVTWRVVATSACSWANAEVFRYVAAVLMVGIGLLMLPGFQAQLGCERSDCNWADARFSGVRSGASGQFWVGVLLGAVWSPCVAPTLGQLPCLQRRTVTLVKSASSVRPD
jgi:cytochrome c biogenesis protein CcdA